MSSALLSAFLKQKTKQKTKLTFYTGFANSEHFSSILPV